MIRLLVISVELSVLLIIFLVLLCFSVTLILEV